MVQVYHGGKEHFDALAYGRPHPGTVNFIQSRMDQFTNVLTNVGRQFMENVNTFVEWVDESRAARLAQAVGRKMLTIWESDEIRTLLEIYQFQHAPLKMQRYIMAEPTIRKKYHSQLVDGYSDTYVDAEPDRIGERHYDYRRVMNGIVVETQDGWKATTYSEDLRNEDYDLTHAEQWSILKTWDNLVSHLKHGKDDPTSAYNGSLRN